MEKISMFVLKYNFSWCVGIVDLLKKIVVFYDVFGVENFIFFIKFLFFI